MLAGATLGDGPADNNAAVVRPIPPPGIDVDPAKAGELAARCAAVRVRWDELVESAVASQKRDQIERVSDLAAEVLVFPRSVEMAIELNQFYRPVELAFADRLLDEAERRIGVIRDGGDWKDVVFAKPDPTTRPHTVIGGYRSEIDGSFQPYGLVLPAGTSPTDTRPRRLDLWFHGRGEKLSEVAFLGGQWASTGEYTPPDTFVLHPYGRYSNAFRFAGEMDVHEVLAYIRGRVAVDPHQIAVRGFSMGGAACWQFATRYPDRWFAANPGAGFSETAGFLDFFQGEPVRESTPWYQQKLWNLYDSPPYALNLTQCPTVVYSGERDRQKQAADVMQVALAEHGIDMTHIIGPDTDHKLHPASKLEIESRLASLAAAHSNRYPTSLEFTTYTLSHHRMHWVDIQGLVRHWEPATVSAEVDGPLAIRLETKNVTRLTLDFPPGQWPGLPRGRVSIRIDGTELPATLPDAPMVRSDRSLRCQLVSQEGTWRLLAKNAEPVVGLRKQPGLQGPIDDAFNRSFVFVLPSGKSPDSVTQKWFEQEAQHAMHQWRNHFRGDVRVVGDDEVDEAWLASANLILFGDPRTNRLIEKIAPSLPIRWDENEIAVGSHAHPSTGRVIAMIYPNPLNPQRYVVLNSGFTFRQYDFLNNARQTPKLPDWAVIDVSDGATTRDPGKIDSAGFFDEQWRP